MKSVIIGDTHKFAIESSIMHAYAHLSFRALGLLLLHIGGDSYGVRSMDAIMLSCSLDEVRRRILRRGSHTAPFSNIPNAVQIASAVYNAIHASGNEEPTPLGISASQLSDLIHTHHIQWAHYGDEPFDDGYRILQFDVGPRVRIIAYKPKLDKNNQYCADPMTIKDQWLEADEFLQHS